MKWLTAWAYALMVLVTALAMFGLLSFRQHPLDLSLLSEPYYQNILSFSVKQALLSALLSVAVGWPVARAVYYLPSLPGRRWFLSLCLLSFVMPTLIVITGLVALFGRSGWLSLLLPDSWNLYGLNGILLAHTLLNVPFVVRVLTAQMERIPAISWKLADQMRLATWQRLRFVEWQSIRHAVWLCFGFVAVLCFNSFAVVLALGGGPKSTTLEVAVYQSLKYDFNISEALLLSWLQWVIATAALLFVLSMGRLSWLNLDTRAEGYHPRVSKLRGIWMTLLYVACWMYLVSPWLALLPGFVSAQLSAGFLSQLLSATSMTLMIAAMVTILALVWGYALLHPIRSVMKSKRLLLDVMANHGLVLPAMVLSVGIYIVVLQYQDPESWGLFWIIVINSLLVIPFILSQMKPGLMRYDQQYQHLVLNCRLTGWQRITTELSYLKPSIKTATALALVLAMGDVSVFAIFGHPDITTLSWLIYRYAGTYRLQEASIASVVLLSLCAIVIFWLESRHVDR